MAFPVSAPNTAYMYVAFGLGVRGTVDGGCGWLRAGRLGEAICLLAFVWCVRPESRPSHSPTRTINVRVSVRVCRSEEKTSCQGFG